MKHFSFKYDYPTKTQPEWAPQVERWYQLDAAAYGLTELYWRHRAELRPLPDQIFLASPGASNLTDWQFASGPPSPSKFVHTLPNIRSAPLLQVMKWSGRVFCIQKDPSTIVAAIHEASHVGGRSWVVSAFGSADAGFEAHIFVLDETPRRKTVDDPSLHDKTWLNDH